MDAGAKSALADLHTVVVVLVIVSGLSVALWGAVLAGLIRPRRRNSVPVTDPAAVRRAALFYGAGNLAILMNMAGFLAFPHHVLRVAAAMLPLWGACLAFDVKILAERRRAARLKRNHA